ncbi:MAG: tripartite tricarboxylate transporter TctB family protein [Erysipelotrichaceae bacterium]|nr:tripartite tricarboxylate transporter TctB family protein [Erysipelotrichaceae bacterium]
MFDRTDRYLGLAFIALGGACFWSATTWPMYFASDPAGPGAIPKILSVGIMVLGLILTVGGFFQKKKAEKPIITASELRVVGGLTAASIIYIILLQFIGYLIATPLLIAAILLICGMRNVKQIVLISLIGTLVLFLLFYSLLRVNLPLGFMRKFIQSFMPRL